MVEGLKEALQYITGLKEKSMELIDGTLNPGQFVPESLMWIQLL